MLDEFYSVRTPVERLAEEVLKRAGDAVVRCDSADPRIIRELRERGVNAIAVKKGAGSIEFYREGLLYKPLFRKGKMIDYAHYPRIQYAYYMHGNLFAAYRVHFFVFTNRRLSNDELAHINAVAPSEDLIKIRYTRRNYEKLLAALPRSIAASVRRIYETYIRKERAK